MCRSFSGPSWTGPLATCPTLVAACPSLPRRPGFLVDFARAVARPFFLIPDLHFPLSLLRSLLDSAHSSLQLLDPGLLSVGLLWRQDTVNNFSFSVPLVLGEELPTGHTVNVSASEASLDGWVVSFFFLFILPFFTEAHTTQERKRENHRPINASLVSCFPLH